VFPISDQITPVRQRMLDDMALRNVSVIR